MDQIDRQIERQIDRQTDRQIDRQIDAIDCSEQIEWKDENFCRLDRLDRSYEQIDLIDQVEKIKIDFAERRDRVNEIHLIVQQGLIGMKIMELITREQHRADQDRI